MSLSGSSASRNSIWAMTRLAFSSSIWVGRKMIRSLRSREKMSNARSPRAVCSTTIGISAIGYLLAAFASMIALCAAWQRHDTPASVGRSDKREHVYADTEEIPPPPFGKEGWILRSFSCGSGLDGALVVGAEALQVLGIETDAEGQSHRSQDGLDLVERLLAEVLGLEQIGLGLLHQLGDGLDMRAVLRQLDARTDSSSSSTLRNRCSLTSRRTTGAAPVSAPSISRAGACGKSTSSPMDMTS